MNIYLLVDLPTQTDTAIVYDQSSKGRRPYGIHTLVDQMQPLVTLLQILRHFVKSSFLVPGGLSDMLASKL